MVGVGGIIASSVEDELLVGEVSGALSSSCSAMASSLVLVTTVSEGGDGDLVSSGAESDVVPRASALKSEVPIASGVQCAELVPVQFVSALLR